LKKIQDKKKVIRAKSEALQAERKAAGRYAEEGSNLLDEGDEDILF